MNRRDSNNRIKRLFIVDSDNKSDEDLLQAAEEPKVLGDAFVVCPDEIDSGSEGVVSHPLRLYHLFFGLKHQENKDGHFYCEEDS